MAIRRILNRSLPSPTTGLDRWPLHDAASTRLVEQHHTSLLAPHTLMRRAGSAVARLCMALAPHARTAWIACGPGNNGGDGLEAAAQLQQAGILCTVTWLGTDDRASTDTLASLARARQAGVDFSNSPPQSHGIAVDAMLGVGNKPARELSGAMAAWANAMNTASAFVLAVDLPTGLDPDTGRADAGVVRADATLSLLTLKPGLVTAQGRDAAGDIWFDSLLENAPSHLMQPETAWLVTGATLAGRSHTSHKGTFGDVAVIGGAPGMTGAAILAARAALHQGAGRVFVGLLDEGSLAVDPAQPELMFRPTALLDFSQQAVVCGCGGGAAVSAVAARVISNSRQLVLDADALNAVAADAQLQQLLERRGRRGAATILTPHPLEAARLLGTTTAQVQSHRLAAAQQLADRFQCVVVLKGSGTVTARPGGAPCINASGNARLATAGTGDVLAGMCGALCAAMPPTADCAFEAAVTAVFLHGRLADQWSDASPLTASGLSGHHSH